MPLSIVLVHGAWHSPAAWGSFPSLLEEAIGARVVAVALPSVHGAPAAYKAEDDALAIRALIEPELEEGRDVVTICHSYGGVPTADAVKGFLKSDRGAQAAVVGMIYFTSFVLAEGKALIGEQDAAGQSLGISRPVPPNPAHLFYNGIEDPAEVQALVDALKDRHQASLAFTTPVKYAGYRHCPAAYLICTNDNIVSAAKQASLVEEAGVFSVVERLDADHTPWKSRPEGTVAFVKKAVAHFTAQ